MRSVLSVVVLSFFVLAARCESDTQEDCDDVWEVEDACDYVINECESDELINYLRFQVCDLNAQKSRAGAAFGYILLLLWLGYLVSMVAATGDIFFVPALKNLAFKMKLSPSVAGITLLAWGNGANDIFTSIEALSEKDFQLMLGTLVGASTLITSFILGLVLLISDPAQLDIDRHSFLRNGIAYLVQTVVIVIVLLAGKVNVYIGILFLVIYLVYVGFVIVWTRFIHFKPTDIMVVPLIEEEERVRAGNANFESNDSECGVGMSPHDVPAHASSDSDAGGADPEFLAGLSWPRGASRFRKVVHVIMFPACLALWLSTTAADGKWGRRRRWSAVIFPIPCLLVCLLDYGGDGGAGFRIRMGGSEDGGGFPLYALFIILGALASAAFYFTTNPRVTPRFYVVIAFCGFVGAATWIDLLASEVVNVLRSLGIMWNVSTGLLGVTILAVANSVDDISNDLMVARRGAPATAVATCFGSPMLNDIVGLGVAITATCAQTYPAPLVTHVRLSTIVAWGFLLLSIVSSLVVFPLKQYKPPKWFGAYLVAVYVLFIVFSVIAELGYFGGLGREYP